MILLAACSSLPLPEPPVLPEPIALAAPEVGAAEGYLKLPIGTPLAGYTARCTCLGGFSNPDARDSDYALGFVESAGVQTWPSIDVIWVRSGDEDLVLTKLDAIYSFDGLVVALEERLEQETGARLAGRVVNTANHSHGAFGAFNQGTTWFLGSDRYDEEIFQRVLDAVAGVAIEAHAKLEPAKIGVGWATDWDPTDAVYRDRRSVNDALAPWGPDGPQGLGKDPHLGVVRFDTLAGDPLAVIVNFGMHGTLTSERDALVSGDSGAHLELGLQETWDHEVVTMFTQGSGGDASPGGRGDGYARMESIGVIGAPLIRALVDEVQTSADPVHLETATRSISKQRDEIAVHRGDEVWTYAPFEAEEDGIVYDEDGSIASPIDEFAAEFGALFCGQGGIGETIGSDVFPYESCVDVPALVPLVKLVFGLGDDDISLPFPESISAQTTLTRLGPLPTRRADGSSVAQDLVVGFFPGEPVYSFGEQWRRRVLVELGLPDAMMFGYSQDHEGYLLIPEDWLLGGYEPDITVWGPLEAEHVMEGVLATGAELLATTHLREDPDPAGVFGPTTYPDLPLPERILDLTPDAGTRLTTAPDALWTPFEEHVPNLVVPAQVPRVSGVVEVAWEGGDPAVDSPSVVLETLVGGEWRPVTTHTGRVVDEARPDILVTHTPTPLSPSSAPQTHQYWAAWQAVAPWDDRAGLPLGTYRLRVAGQAWGGAATSWPWDTRPYEWTTEPFEVVPAELVVTSEEAGVYASLVGPPHGWRLVDVDGQAAGDNPVSGPVTVAIDSVGGREEVVVEPVLDGYRSRLPVTLPADVLAITVTDVYGNVGAWP